MELTIKERMALLTLLGPEGDLIYLRAKRDLVRKVGIDAEELVELKVTEEDGMMALPNPDDWDKKKEIAISGGEAAIIVNALTTKLEETKKLHENELSLYEKFVEK